MNEEKQTSPANSAAKPSLIWETPKLIRLDDAATGAEGKVFDPAEDHAGTSLIIGPS